MSAMDEQILRTAKEIVVKFIETGRVSPSGFAESFRMIYQAVDDTVRGSRPAADCAAPPAPTAPSVKG